MIEFQDNESLLVWLIGLLGEHFPRQAILKGGMELRLLNCPRHTNDLDYVFVPFSSKNDVVGPVLDVLQKQGLSVEYAVHSTCIRMIVSGGRSRVQLEINVAAGCKTQELSTADLARLHNQQGRIIRAMSLDVALAHKLAAWLERGLTRDLYDVYFMGEILGVIPERETLGTRLKKIRYQRKDAKGPRSMDVAEFAGMLRSHAAGLRDHDIQAELQGLMSPDEIPGLEFKLRKAMLHLAEKIEHY